MDFCGAQRSLGGSLARATVQAMGTSKEMLMSPARVKAMVESKREYRKSTSPDAVKALLAESDARAARAEERVKARREAREEAERSKSPSPMRSEAVEASDESKLPEGELVGEEGFVTPRSPSPPAQRIVLPPLPQSISPAAIRSRQYLEADAKYTPGGFSSASDTPYTGKARQAIMRSREVPGPQQLLGWLTAESGRVPSTPTQSPTDARATAAASETSAAPSLAVHAFAAFAACVKGAKAAGDASKVKDADPIPMIKSAFSAGMTEAQSAYETAMELAKKEGW